VKLYNCVRAVVAWWELIIDVGTKVHESIKENWRRVKIISKLLSIE